MQSGERKENKTMTDQDLKDLEVFVENLNDYLEHEFYGEEDGYTIETAIEQDEIGVLCTTSLTTEYGLRDEAVEYQISFFIKEKALKYFFDGYCVRIDRFNSYKEMAGDYWDFDYNAERILEQQVADGILKVTEDGYIDWKNSLYLKDDTRFM